MKKKFICLLALSSVTIVALSFVFAKTPETYELKADKTPLKIELTSDNITEKHDDGYGTFYFSLEGKTELDSLSFKSVDDGCWIYADTCSVKENGHIFTGSSVYWTGFGLEFNVYSPNGVPSITLYGDFDGEKSVSYFSKEDPTNSVYHFTIQEANYLNVVLDTISVEYYC